LTAPKSGRKEFCIFQNKNCTNKISVALWFVEFFTLHLVVYSVFFEENVLGDKKIK
jgi:hypothetical protein